MEPRRSDPRLRLPTLTFGVVLVALLVAPASVSHSFVPRATSVSHASSSQVHPRAAAAPIPHARLHLGPHASLATGEYYTQNGFSIGSVAGGSATGLSRLNETIPLVVSPYSVGYELNGLTTTGDWWQIVVGDNWPGCNAGFEEIIEVWGVGDASGPVNCDSNVSLSSGDKVALSLNFSAGGDGCLNLDDLTTHTYHPVCQAQPDAGATQFSYMSGAANGDGYFTGPMTEVINLTTTSCPDYLNMPWVQYEYPAGFYITGYFPWSDEFDLFSGTTCYSNQGFPEVALTSWDPSSHFLDTSSGNGYGPRWTDGQNFSRINPSFGFRYETDPKPITYVGFTSNATIASQGSVVGFHLNGTGGSGGDSALWYLNASFNHASAGLAWNWTATAPGRYTFIGYLEDSKGDVGAPAKWINVTVPSILESTGIVASPPSGADVGQRVTFTEHPAGGIGPYSFAWSGLPAGCATANLTSISCTVSIPSPNSVRVQVSDWNGSQVTSPTLNYPVSPDPSVSVSAPPTYLDVGQVVWFNASVNGGASPYTFAWFGLPPSCPSVNSTTYSCRVPLAGPIALSVSLLDANGYAPAAAWANFTVAPDPQVTVTSNRTVVDVGESVGFIAVANGGSGGFAFVWTGLPTSCPANGLDRMNCSVTSATLETVRVSVTDLAGFTVTSPAYTLPVNPALTVALPASSTSVAFGVYAVLQATPSGGTPLYSYLWSGLPPGCSSPGGAVLNCSATTGGTYTITVTVHDATGATATAVEVIHVAPGPSNSGLSIASIWPVFVVIAAIAIGLGAAIARNRARPPPVAAN